MKKKTASMSKSDNDKKLKSKVAKVSTKPAVGKVQKKVASPRGPQKPKITNVEHINNDQLKAMKAAIKTEASESLTNPVATKVKNGKKKNSTKNSPVADKMAAVRKDRDETRAQPKKKRKTQVPEEASVPVKKEKKVKVEKIADHSAKVEGPKKSKKHKSKSKLDRQGNLELTKEHVLKTVEAILTIYQKTMETKKTLLPIESTPIFLQVLNLKIPKCPRIHIRPQLPHSIVGPLDDVVLFVRDLVKGRKQDCDKTIDHWETVLRQKGVDCIKEIIPINKVRTEYSQYEMQRKLATAFDYHLADGRICGHLTHLLGKPFFQKCNAPTPIKLDRDDLKKEITTALHKGCMEVHEYGNCHVMKIGTVSMDKKKLAQNVLAACKVLGTQYPGGWDNIRAIRLKTTKGMAIPIYINLAKNNSIKVPVIKPKRPRAYETVEGELTTIPGKTTVKITPEGKVTVKRERDDQDQVKEKVKEESDEENEEAEEESSVEDEE